MITVELRKLFRRPRTWAALFLLDALPSLVAILVFKTRLAPRPGQGPAFLSAVLDNGSLFGVAALAIVLPLFLPISVAVIAGEAVAGGEEVEGSVPQCAPPGGRRGRRIGAVVGELVVERAQLGG